MSVQRFATACILLCLSIASAEVTLAAPAPTPAPSAALPFSVRDMVRMERISEAAVAPDGRHVVYTQRSTDMEANKGKTSIWLLDLSKHGSAPVRLTDAAANSSSAEWSKD